MLQKEILNDRRRTNSIIRLSIILTVLFAFVLFFLAGRYMKESITTQLHRNAIDQLNAITEFRRYYSENVIQALGSTDAMASHIHTGIDGVVPLPATLAIEISNHLSRVTGGNTRYRTVSKFPYPTRANRVLTEFENDALEYFEHSGNRTNYSRDLDQGNHNIHSVAVPIIMYESCVSCHNAHELSPKTNWQVGDVRGVQVIEVRYDNWLSFNNAQLNNVLFMSFLTFAAVCMSIWLLNRRNSIAVEETARLAQAEQLRNTQLMQANELANEKEQFINAVFDTVLETIITLDCNGIIRSANKSVERVLGYRPSELIGNNITILVDPDTAAKHDKYIRDYLAGRKEAKVVGKTRQAVAIAKDGTALDVMLSVNEATLGDDKIFVGSISDISNRVHYEAQLIAALDKAKHANEVKSRFLATMSHEIRTPLNAIINLNEIVMDSDLDEEQFKMIKTARDSGKALSEIVNDILDFSRIEAGELTLMPVPIDLEALFMAVCNLLIPTAQAKGLDFNLEMSVDLPVHILADGSRLRQVIVNLVGNAVKFTDSGWVKLRVIEKRLRGGSITLRFEVEDTGSGISDEDKVRLFNEFTQLEESGRNNQKGTGLGLAISKRLCRLMGGRIGVDDSPTGGSLFHFEVEFPLAELDSKAEDAANSEVNLSNTIEKILVVEDSIPNQVVMKHILEAAGYKYDIASNGEIAVKLVAENEGEYDLILMDVSMPIMDGYQASQIIRKSGFEKPIIALSAYAFSDDVERSFEFGMDGYIRKPIDKKNLFREISRICNQHENEQGNEVQDMIDIIIEDSLKISPSEFESVLVRRLQRLQHAVEALSNACEQNKKDVVLKQCALIGNKSYLGQLESIRITCEDIEASAGADSDSNIKRKVSMLISQSRQVISELTARKNHIIKKFKESKRKVT